MYIIDFLKGFVYGVLGILPGLSGGTFAVYTGDYDRLITIIVEKKYNLKNIIFIILILLGMFCGLIVFSNVLLNLFNSYNLIFKFIIAIINIYILYSFYRKGNIHIISLLIIIIISLLFIISIKEIFVLFKVKGILLIILSSLAYSFGKVVPGVSSTPFLINIGVYNKLLKFYGKPFSSFILSPLYWSIFWILFIIFSILLIVISYKIKDTKWFYKFLVFIQVVNVYLLFK